MKALPEIIDDTGKPPASPRAPRSRTGAGSDDDMTADAEPAAEPAWPMAEAGNRPGRVWALPRGPGCAAHARKVLAEALAGFGVPADLIGDARLMVSELATNAYQHAGEHGPHELWLYLAEPPGPPGGPPASEVRCAIFDAHVEARLPGYSWTSGDCGRGLSIVRELSEGRWGMLRTMSRLGPPVQGKAVWFGIPL